MWMISIYHYRPPLNPPFGFQPFPFPTLHLGSPKSTKNCNCKPEVVKNFNPHFCLRCWSPCGMCASISNRPAKVNGQIMCRGRVEAQSDAFFVKPPQTGHFEALFDWCKNHWKRLHKPGLQTWFKFFSVVVDEDEFRLMFLEFSVPRILQVDVDFFSHPPRDVQAGYLRAEMTDAKRRGKLFWREPGERFDLSSRSWTRNHWKVRVISTVVYLVEAQYNSITAINIISYCWMGIFVNGGKTPTYKCTSPLLA